MSREKGASRRSSLSAASLLLSLVASLALLAGCGGGGGGDESAPPPDPNAPTSTGRGFVTIESPTDVSSFTTEESSVVLRGPAFISPDRFVCCSGSATDTAVTVTWTNSTGGGGAASQSVNICPGFFGFGMGLCDHTFSAEIPLTLGANVIQVSATDGGRHSGTDTITVTRNRETTPPTVTSTNPVNLATNVAVNRSISVTFSEAMDNTSITPATFTLRDNAGGLVAGTITIANRTATFQPAGFVAAFTLHTATVSTGVRDAGGNPLTAAHSWAFTTGSFDLTPPSVASVSPAAASTCSAIDQNIVAVFSEPVAPATVSNLGVSPSFHLADVTGGPSGTFTLSGQTRVLDDGITAVFDPSGPLAFSRTYTATLTRGIRDLAGNQLTANFPWTFSTPASGVGAWRATSTIGVPPASQQHSTLWTGSEMIVFGGVRSGFISNSGARYNPASDTWASLPAGGPALSDHLAVWTGTEMVVWQGTGSRYNPMTETWTPISAVGAPSARSFATAVWTGSEMLVWGGRDSSGLISAHGAYNPSTDTWRAISNAGAPNPRVRHTAVWTGNRMIVWGG